MSKKTDKKCSACGTSPVNHKLIFISNFLDETIGRVDSNFKFIKSREKWESFSLQVEKVLTKILVILGILHFSKDKEKARTGRSKLVWEEAERRGIPMEQFIVFNTPIELYRAKINGKMFHFASLPIPPWLPQSGYDWLDDKFILLEKLSKEGIRAPKTVKISRYSEAEKAFNKMSKPLILKPRSGSRGRHTTTNINTKEELKRAISVAREITLWSVLQEHLFGGVCRATVVNGELVGFFRALPPQITGNGVNTIIELIEVRNKNKVKRISDIIVNEDLLSFIERQGYKINSVLENGVTIDLSAKTGRMYGGYTREMLKEVHPKMYEIFRRAAKVIDVPVAGFDLIIEDPAKDPDAQRWGIIECNSLPFIDLHYFALEGEPVNLAKNVWDLWNTK